MPGRFDAAVSKLIELEGGYVNDPADPGGETQFGISARSYPHLSIGNLTRADAEKIYYDDWWHRWRYYEIQDDDLAAYMLILGVNVGPVRAAKLLQHACIETGGECGIVDGNLGDKTLMGVNHHPAPGWLLDRLRLRAIGYYQSLGKPKYLNGWIRRALS